MQGAVIAVIAVLITLVVAVPITYFVSISNHKKTVEAKIGSAEERARKIIDDALKTAETKKREALLEVKEESLKTKNDLEKETRERRSELQRYEKRVLSKEEAVDKKADAIEKREAGLTAKEEELRKKSSEIERLSEERVQELERISGLTSEQAKEYLLKTVEDEVKHDTAKLYKELEARAKEDAGKKAKEYVVNAIQKCAADHVSETTISVVQLPNDEMKGRIIGREGRNIRTLETMTGVDLIIDDTPEAVILSSFDPIRRGCKNRSGEAHCGRTYSSGQNRGDGRESTKRSGEHDPRGRRSRYSRSRSTRYPSGTCSSAGPHEVPYQLWSERAEAFH